MVSLINWFNDDIKKLIWFKKWFPLHIFHDIDRLIAYYIYFCADMAITINTKSLEVFIDVELQGLLIRDKFNFDDRNLCPYIDYALPRPLDNVYGNIATMLKQNVEARLQMERGESFKLDVAIALKKAKEEQTKLVFMQTAAKMTQGYDEKYTLDCQRKIAEIDKLYGELPLKDLSILTGEVMSTDDDDDDGEYLFEPGFKTLDTDLHGGFQTGRIYSIGAPPKGGKTKFICNMIYKALLQGINVYFDSLEWNDKAIRNILVALHCYTVYNIVIPDSMMSAKYLNDEQKSIIKIARQELFGDLREKSGVGQLFVNSSTTLSTLKTNLIEHIELYNTKLYCLDYAGFLSAGDNPDYKRKQKYEIISDAYRQIHDVVLSHHVCAIIATQLNKEGNDACLAGKEPDNNSFEGGQEVPRTSDYVLAIVVNPKTRLIARTVCFVNSRISAGFKPFTVKCNLGVSVFAEIDKVNGG